MKNSKIIFMSLAVICLTLLASAATPAITGVTAQQRYPWNGKVDISYTVSGDVPAGATLKVTATDRTANTTYTARRLSGDRALSEGTHLVVWDMDAEELTFKSTNVTFKVSYEMASGATYCIIDLSAGMNASNYPVTYMTDQPDGGFNTDEYKTTKLVLRLIGPGSFEMCGNYDVTLTTPFYCGIFEVTQRQYELVTGAKPSRHSPSHFSAESYTRPVENVSWNMIRGDSDIYNWPGSTAVDPDSFIGRIRARTGLNFDLPTEAQWEYACRAGTTTDYNNGKNNSMADVGRYGSNGGYISGTASVGSYLPNAWGLYDMHGNVWEWCLDYWSKDLSSGVTDPVGPSSGSNRVRRGGGWDFFADVCTSSYRSAESPRYEGSSDYGVGFRLVRTLSN